MPSIKTLLCPVDFSQMSRAVLDYAVFMAQSHQAQLKQLVATLPIPATFDIRFGRAADEIVIQAKDDEVELIVMGSHGRSGISHLLVGSVAESVVRHAPCPVLVVRQ